MARQNALEHGAGRRNGAFVALVRPGKGKLNFLLITLTEFIFGVIFNIYLNLNVWDYSGMAFNLMGQVCLPYTLLWFALGLPVYYIVGQIKKAVS